MFYRIIFYSRKFSNSSIKQIGAVDRNRTCMGLTTRSLVLRVCQFRHDRVHLSASSDIVTHYKRNVKFYQSKYE